MTWTVITDVHRERRRRSNRTPNGARHRTFRITLSLLLVWAPIVGCRSTDGTRGQRVGNIQITQVGGYVEYVLRDRRREQESRVAVSKTESQERIVEERIKIETEGYVYHPNLLEFTLAGLFGLLQQDFEDTFDGRRRNSSDNGTVTEFDLSGSLFRRKTYPGTVSVRRYRSLVARPFQSSLETTTTGYGFIWQYINEKTPTTIQFNDTEVLLDPLDDREANGRQKTTEFRFETEYKLNLHSAVKLTYESRSQSEEPFRLDFDTDEVTVSHRLDFGKDYAHRLESELNFFNQRGTFDIERFRWREVLRLRHSETLDSWYRLELIDRTQGTLFGVEPIEERSWMFTGSLEHRLFESLVSQVTGFAQNQAFGSRFTVRRYGTQASFSYRKKNRWGTLRASYRAGLRSEERRGGERELEALDERGAFNDPEPIRLSNANAVQASIFMTAEDRTTMYIQGRDYTVRLIGDFIELERVVTGRIADGETVLIDYVYRSGGDLVLETINSNFTIRQELTNGFSPYYRFSRQDQTLRPRSASGITPEDITGHIGGLEYRKGSVRLLGEYEDHGSTISPFRALRFSADWTHRFENGGAPSLRARWSDVRHGTPNERTLRFLTLEGRYRRAVGRDFTMEASVMYRNQQDSVGTDDEGFDVDLVVEWTLRETNLRITYEWSQFDNDFAKSESSSLFLQLRRSF